MGGGASIGIWWGVALFASGLQVGLAAGLLAIMGSPAYCTAAYMVGFVPGAIYQATSNAKKKRP